MKNIEFSVVIPLYNKEKHIADCVNSVLQQSLAATEIVIVDDGSTDNSAAEVAKLNDPRIRLVSQKNQGVSVARNTGIEEAKCEYIAFLDADDIWMPFFLEEMYYLIMRYPTVGFYASRYQCVDGENQYSDAKIALPPMKPEGQLLDNYFEIASKGDLPFMISSTVVSKTLVAEIGDFPVGEKIGEDQDFFARAALAGPLAYCSNINLLYHRDSENKATINWVPETECPFSERLKEKAESGALDARTIRDIERYSAAHLCDLAKKHIKAQQPHYAKQLLLDNRCNRKPLHRVCFSFLAQLQGVKQRLSGTATNTANA